MLPQLAPKPSMSLVPPSTIGELQSQLQETQNALANHTNKFHILNLLIAKHNSFKRENNPMTSSQVAMTTSMKITIGPVVRLVDREPLNLLSQVLTTMVTTN